MAAFERLDIVKRQPPKNSSFGLFGSYDANVLGGLLIGVGMGSTGACPGTVLVQVATGIKSGIFVASGGFLGGILYSRFGKHLKIGTSSSPLVGVGKDTIQAKFDLNPDHLLLGYEIMCLIIVSAATMFGLGGSSPWVHPVFGGALIGSAQAASLLLRSSPVGVSKAYEEAGDCFWRTFPSTKAEGTSPPVAGMTFASGILVGSILLAQCIPNSLAKAIDVSKTSAVIGGCAMVFGARLAGGCTSGHGISGMSSFSIASVITVASMFGGGIMTAMLLR